MGSLCPRQELRCEISLGTAGQTIHTGRAQAFHGSQIAGQHIENAGWETRLLGQPTGTAVEITAGELLACRPAGCPEGTSITIENLFFTGITGSTLVGNSLANMISGGVRPSSSAL